MAKNYYLPGLLFAAAICIYCYSGSPALISRAHHPKPIAHTPNLTSLKVKQLYDAGIGIREQGNNAGSRIEEYLDFVNLKKGDPWCAAFICWVYGQAGVSNPRTGWSPALFPESRLIWKRAYLSLKKPDTAITPRTGDIFGIWFPEKNRIAHAGFVDQWNDQWAITVEGNTNITGGRDGDGVYKKRRLVRSLYCVARYISLRLPDL